ncbi:BTAD domain-containing putative transcriptional regulator [Meiothermus sp. CFH 77666]|uniref:AfsR/SARP family transcriptional regulator n=1 Tax=Meiothermus sp. CFH 77666 TaxID=2817942 RepID=UPI001AA05244|nr:BTAD domain-containing putative transcriptional regulator [Meiothermus sp. CFH 77666]MBO1436185.1 response regulator receiver protein [Meiothermus sp. CFH 77666]
MKRMLTRSEQATPALRVRTLGQVEVLVAGRPAVWHAHTAEELFFYLLSYPEGRSKGEILETLWGLDPDPIANNRFRVTVFRIRTALGNPAAILEDHGRYRLAEEILHSTDLYDFYQALAEGQRATHEALRLESYLRAISLYRGDYLPGYSTNWVSQAREEHKAAYVQALLEVALIHYDREDWRATALYLERALKTDPYIGENYHQRLMWCLAASGDRFGAIEHYRRFVKFLHEELGDTPMPETQALAEHIKQGEPIAPYHEVRGLRSNSPQA